MIGILQNLTFKQYYPLSKQQSVGIFQTEPGIYEVIFNSKPLRNLLNNPNLSLKNELTLEEIASLEDFINQNTKNNLQ